MATHETAVSGVRTFWADSDRPTLTATLMFRCGQGDETLATSGWTHLVEHLALEGRGSVGLDVNGSVGLVLTMLDVHGTPDAVVSHLADLTGWLTEPDLSRVEHESKVLTAEAMQRSGGPIAEALLWRYGAAGPGLCAFDEPGLSRVCADGLGEVIRGALTAGNAVLCLDGPIPDGLTLTLPPGELVAPPTPLACDDPIPHRAAYQTAGAWCASSGVVSRTVGATIFEAVLQRRTSAVFREELGASYSPFTVYERLTRDDAVVVSATDLTDFDPGRAARAMLEITDALAESGPTETEVHEHVERMLRDMGDPRADSGWPWLLGRAYLLGEQRKSRDDLFDELSRADCEAVQAAATEFATSRMVGVSPAAKETGPAMAWLRQPSAQPKDDSVYHRSVDFPLVDERIGIGAGGVQHESALGRRDFSFDALAGVLAYPDGGRTLVRHDAYQLTVEPGLWKDGKAIVDHIDSGVTTDIVLPQPERNADLIPRPRTTWWQRHRAWLGRIVGAGVGSVAVLSFLVFAAIKGFLAPALVGVAITAWFATRERD